MLKLGVIRESREHGNPSDLFPVQVVPVNAARPGQPCMAFDDLVRSDYEVQRYVVRPELYFLIYDLDRMNRCDDRRPGSNFPCLTAESILEVRVSAALADSGAVAADRDRAAQNKVYAPHFLQADLAAVVKCALDARCLINVLPDPDRV